MMKRYLLLIPLMLLMSTTYAQKEDCAKVDLVYLTIAQAIEIGAPTYNKGNHLACYRIYEGAAYKVIHLYGKKCKKSRTLLETALELCHSSEESATTKAWVMRAAFDKILGEPTVTEPNLN